MTAPALGHDHSHPAVNENYHYTLLNIKDGLPSSEVYEIFQDSKGFLWIGTDKGVARFNGSFFEKFTTVNGLTDNTIFMIKEDAKGRVWFLGLNRRLCYYEEGAFKEYPYNTAIANSFKHIYQGLGFSKFEVTEQGELTIGVADRKMVRIDSNGMLTPIQGNIIEGIFSKMKKAASLNEFVSQINFFEQEYIAAYPVRFFHTDLAQKAYYLDNQFYFTTEQGVVVINWNDPSQSQRFLNNYKITSLCKDFEGGFWFGTQFNGLIHVPNFNIKKFKLNGTDKKNYFHGILLQDQKPVFIYGNSHRGKGVNFEINHTEATLEEYTPYLRISDIPAEMLKRGIRLESRTYFEDIPHGVSAILQINEDTYITAHSGGELLVRKRVGNTYPVSYSFKSLPKVLDLFSLQNSQVLVGTSNGLYKMNVEQFTISKVPKSLPFSDYRIQDIDQTNNGDIIIATRGNGLFIWSELDVQRFGKNSGLKTNIINQVFYDQPSDEIYVASNVGISKLLGNHLVVNLINENHGVESTDIRQFLLQNDTLYLANNNAVSYLPLNQKGIIYPKPYIYENFFLINDSLPFAPTYSYQENNLKLSYTGISYKSPKGVTYSTRIKPLQTEWHTTRDHVINLENLGPASYEIEVRAVNSIGLYSSPLTYSFEIRPPFWKQTWFKVLLAGLIIVLIYISTNQAILYYKRQLQTQKNIKQLQSLSLQAKMNPHFIFNSLNSIQNFILKNEKEKASEYLLDFAQLARLTITNSDSTTVSLFNEIKTLRLYTELEKKRVRRHFSFIEKIDTAIDLKGCLIPTLLLQPYIENAIWHGRIHNQENGFVELKVELNNNLLFFEITDNGIGINASKKLKNKLNFEGNESTKINEERIKLISELHQDLSRVEIDHAFFDNVKKVWYGTKVSFTIPYILNK